MIMFCCFRAKDQPNGGKFIVGNVHLESDPHYDYVKMAQSLYLLDGAVEIIQHFGEKEEYRIPLIVGGDFNSRPSSSVQSLLHYDESIAEPSW